ncbi:TPA: hypothetical protein NJ359_004668 [Vibrio parahaemolyticus]|nr:hypothetical protein [Vibrio parahaemolyticus]HCG7289055.1 hypothetical protein [Vibrio parahaemolyticus]
MSMYKKKVYMLSLLLLFGCKSTEQLLQERKAAVSDMDNLDVCYNLGKQSDFEYWKLIKTEQFRRQTVTLSWDVPAKLCDEAIEMGRIAQARILHKNQGNTDNLVNAINSASKSIGDGYKKSAEAYSSSVRTTCQSYGSVTNCTSY